MHVLIKVVNMKLPYMTSVHICIQLLTSWTEVQEQQITTFTTLGQYHDWEPTVENPEWTN